MRRKQRETADMARMQTYPVLALAALLIAVPGLACAAAEALPAGLKTRDTKDGLALADAQGRLLYRLDLDRYRARRKDMAKLVEARCADICQRLWRPVSAPPAFKPDGEWGVVERAGAAALLTYKGDPLYSFTGKSLDEAAEAPIAPSYFSSYAAKPTELRDGVPVGTIYWHAALYQPPPPKTAAPAGVSAQWLKAAYVFADRANHRLYTAKDGRTCRAECGGLTPLPAPMAALPVGEWRPVEGGAGQRVWAYKGRIVYRATADDAAPGAAWQALEAR
jgi:predicted lipoprotein with Yx(FWY)xxD motif